MSLCLCVSVVKTSFYLCGAREFSARPRWPSPRWRCSGHSLGPPRGEWFPASLRWRAGCRSGRPEPARSVPRSEGHPPGGTAPAGPVPCQRLQKLSSGRVPSRTGLAAQNQNATACLLRPGFRRRVAFQSDHHRGGIRNGMHFSLYQPVIGPGDLNCEAGGIG